MGLIVPNKIYGRVWSTMQPLEDHIIAKTVVWVTTTGIGLIASKYPYNSGLKREWSYFFGQVEWSIYAG